MSNSKLLSSDNFVNNTFFIVLFFLLFNPVVSLIFVIILGINHNYSKSISFWMTILSYTVFFYDREYDVQFYSDSTDDVPVYISYYLNLSGISFSEIFKRFIVFPSGNEPVWHIIWWFVNYFTNSHVGIFVFLHYLVIFYFFANISRILFPVGFEIVFLLLLFLFPVTLYNICHIWRQILSFEFFILGSLLYFQKDKRGVGLGYIILSVFTHISSLYFLVIFILYIIYLRFVNKITKKNLMYLTLIILVFIGLSLQIIITILGETFSRLANYTEGASANREGIGFKLTFYLLLTIYAFIKSNLTRFNAFLLLNIFIPLCLPFLFPALNSIYDRYFSLALTALSLYLFMISVHVRHNLIIIREKLLFFLIITLILVNFIKLFMEYQAGIGVIAYIGDSNAFNVTNGLIRFLYNFIFCENKYCGSVI